MDLTSPVPPDVVEPSKLPLSAPNSRHASENAGSRRCGASSKRSTRNLAHQLTSAAGGPAQLCWAEGSACDFAFFRHPSDQPALLARLPYLRPRAIHWRPGALRDRQFRSLHCLRLSNPPQSAKAASRQQHHLAADPAISERPVVLQLLEEIVAETVRRLSSRSLSTQKLQPFLEHRGFELVEAILVQSFLPLLFLVCPPFAYISICI